MRSFKSTLTLLSALALVVFAGAQSAHALALNAIGDGNLNQQLVSVNLNTAGTTDTDINNTNEAIAIHNAFEANGNGLFNTGNQIVFAAPVSNKIYNIETINTVGGAPVIDFAGGGGDFGTNNPYTLIADNGLPGGAFADNDDFSIRARTTVTFNTAGTYSISAASDDGRLVRLNGAVLSQNSQQQVTVGPGLGEAGDNQFGFNNPTGHNRSVGSITVNAGDMVDIDAFMWERGGGDSFEIAIRNGVGNCCGSFELLGDGALGGDISMAGGWQIDTFNLIGGGGSNDNDINTTSEALAIWNAIDGGQGTGTTGLISGGLDVQVDQIYNITGVTDVENTNLVNYGGGNGDFGGNTAYGTINDDGPGGGGGPVNGGDDFSIKTTGFMQFMQGGQYSIAIASDDGRRLELTAEDLEAGSPFAGFIAKGGQGAGGGDEDAFSLHQNGTTGHNRTVGVFEVLQGDVLELEGVFFERGGGDSYEISIKFGNDTGFGGPGDGWILLSDAVNQGLIRLSAQQFQIVPEPTTAVLGLLGLAGLARRRRQAA